MTSVYLGVIASSACDMHFFAATTAQTRTHHIIDWINEQVEAGGVSHPDAFELPYATTTDEVAVRCIEDWLGWAVTLEEVDLFTT